MHDRIRKSRQDLTGRVPTWLRRLWNKPPGGCKLFLTERENEKAGRGRAGSAIFKREGEEKEGGGNHPHGALSHHRYPNPSPTVKSFTICSEGTITLSFSLAVVEYLTQILLLCCKKGTLQPQIHLKILEMGIMSLSR